MNPIDQAWAIIKQSDDYGDVATSLEHEYDSAHDRKHDCNGYADEVERGNPNPRPDEPMGDDLCGHPACETCGPILADVAPDKEDYMPSDGEGYEGALNEWKDKYGNQ